jgi:hypothetical protein
MNLEVEGGSQCIGAASVANCLGTDIPPPLPRARSHVDAAELAAVVEQVQAAEAAASIGPWEQEDTPTSLIQVLQSGRSPIRSWCSERKGLP